MIFTLIMENAVLKISFGVVILILILQAGFIFSLTGKVSSLDKELYDTKEKLNSNNAEFQNKINELNNYLSGISSGLSNVKSGLIELESGLGEFQQDLSDVKGDLSDIEGDLSSQINNLKAGISSDFSGIIDDVIGSVVSVQTDVSQGSGFIITKDGYVITNAHVLSGAAYANAVTLNQRTKPMDLIGYSSSLDIALLKIEGNYDFLELDDSDTIKVGEKVIAIGNPYGLSFSVSEGIVSAIDRNVNGLPYYIQTDAALNPGNSGGPLINTEGKAIGINNFKISGDNLGFALESNYIKEAANEISLKELGKKIL